MGRNKGVFLALILALLLGSRAMGDDAAKTLVVPNTALALPDGCGVKARWVSPPIDPEIVDKASLYDMCFAIDTAGRPWIGYQDEKIINPVRQYQLELPQRYTSFTCLENGAFLVTTESDLCFIVPPKKLEMTYDKIPAALYQPISNLPAPESKLFPGTGNNVYFVAPCTDGGSDVYYMSPKDTGAQGFIKVFTSKNKVSAVTGDSGSAFIALGGVIVKVMNDGTVTKIYSNPREHINQLAYCPGTGLFYRTYNGIGYIGAKGSMQIMAVPSAQISIRNGTLYVLLMKSLGVLALDNISDLKRFDRAIKEVAVTESKDIKITSIRFFEAGKDVPNSEDRKFAASFDHKTTRFVYCQVDLDNLQYQKLHQRQTFTMELYRAGRDNALDSENISFDIKPDYSSMWGWVRFGSDQPGTLYPGEYTVKTYLAGTLIDESKFTVTGEPDILEAAGHHDAAAVSKLIKSGADVNTSDNAGYTPLMYAVLTSDTDIMKLLIGAGANVNTKTTEGDTALTLDAGNWEDDPTIAKMLLDAGADVNAQGKDANTALHRAVYKNQVAVTEFLLGRGAKTELKNKDGQTPLIASNIKFSYETESTAKIVESLLAHGADPEAKDSYGCTAIFNAIEGGNIGAISALIKHGADVNATGKVYGVTEQSVLGYTLDQYRMLYSYRNNCEKLKEIAAILQANGADLNTSEYTNAYFRKIDQVLDIQHMAHLLEMSESAADNFDTENPYLRKADIRGLLNAACRKVSDAKNEFGLYDAVRLCKEAGDRARKWGMISSCPEIYFNIGLICSQTGSLSDAAKYLKDYLNMSPTGPCAAKAREILNEL